MVQRLENIDESLLMNTMADYPNLGVDVMVATELQSMNCSEFEVVGKTPLLFCALCEDDWTELL